MKCPCHSGRDYFSCCKPYHDGQLPYTVEALMRSRYCAYSLGLTDYIIETTHPDSTLFLGKQSKEWRDSIEDFSKNTEFSGLEILDTTETTVTFYAHLKQQGKDCSFKEQSLFKKIGEKYFYFGPLSLDPS